MANANRNRLMSHLPVTKGLNDGIRVKTKSWGQGHCVSPALRPGHPQQKSEHPQKLEKSEKSGPLSEVVGVLTNFPLSFYADSINSFPAILSQTQFSLAD
jgi:hypothetical protein